MTGPPRNLFPHVVAFCEFVAPGSTPIYLAVTPAPDDRPLECMLNVRRRIAKEGGEEVLGWKIWEWYGVMIEAELHMVWRSKKKFHKLDRRLRQELVAIDGATVISHLGEVLAVGAILKIPGGSEGGGRLAAARELSKLGLGIKVSQDGGITPVKRNQ